jgi:hypothetical protein
MQDALFSIAQQFKLLKLQCNVRFEQNTELPEFKGSMLHGWFGHALKSVDERAFFILYGEHDPQQPKPYAIYADDNSKTHYRINEHFSFTIVLFGAAVDLADSVVDACVSGSKLGFGKHKTPFELLSVCSLLPMKKSVGIESSYLAEWLPRYEADYILSREIAIQCLSPIRLKEQGRLVSDFPPLERIVNHLARRLAQLTRFWVADDQALLNDFYQGLHMPGNLQTIHHTYFEDWQRYSIKKSRNLPFGGIKGQVSYIGELDSVLPLLIIGQHLLLGGKTTFGLGRYELMY